MKNNPAMWLGAFAAPILLSLWGCARSASAPTADAAPRAQSRNPLEITITEPLRGRIKVGPVTTAAVATTLTVPARIAVDRRHAVRVGTQVDGRVMQVFVHEGDTVAQGQVLAEVYSARTSETQAEFLKACTRQQLARKALERAQLLLKSDVIGVAEVQRREAELAEASAEVSAGREQLSVLGMSQEAIARIQETRAMSSLTRIVAVMSGTILERHVTTGQVVQPSDTAFLIADLANVWLVADVPEQSSGGVRVGQSVEAEIPALPGRPVYGRLSFVSPTVNDETRTVSVRLDLPNPGGRYKPAMLANMTLKGQALPQLVVPSTAVVREDESEHVFVQVTEDKFLLRKVELGEEFQNKRVLTGGLRPGERIVLDGAFHLNNERRRLSLQAAEGG